MRGRLKDFLKFRPEKGPGYGISRGFYLSVLTGTARMPSPSEWVSPKGAGGSVAGFVAPLTPGSTKEDLARPMGRGAYAVASGDQKTVLRCMVLSKEEAGFDPEPFLRSAGAAGLSLEARNRIASTWMLVQFTFESYDPRVEPAVRFLLAVADGMARLTEGVVADPVSQVYRLPGEFVSLGQASGLEVSDVVQARSRRVERGLHVFTLGLQKFDRPEVELTVSDPGLEGVAGRFLLGVAKGVLSGPALELGALVGEKGAALQVATGGLDRGMWEGVPVVELIPGREGSVDAALTEWGRRYGGGSGG